MGLEGVQVLWTFKIRVKLVLTRNIITDFRAMADNYYSLLFNYQYLPLIIVLETISDIDLHYIVYEG